jgi:uncharacterized membrane protein YeiB
MVWERYGRALLQQLEGTLLLPWFLRAIGMRIGRRCLLGAGFAQVVDPDMLELGDGATVHAMFQAHSFEDRVLKMDRVRIAAGATVARGAVVLYGADIHERAHVMQHSVVMKQELLLADRAYAGAPTRTVVRRPQVVAAAAYVAPPAHREVAFDAARGLAVLGMVWMHFVPGDGAAGLLAAIAGVSVNAVEGVPSALFFVLAGVAWAYAAAPRGAERAELRACWVVRRSLALVAMGLPFWIFAWPNDVLVPYAMTLPFVAWLLRRGLGARIAALAAVLAAVPFVTDAFAHHLANDVLVDGTHAANHEFGASTLRWFVFDGAYPLLPWVALPLIGATIALHARGDSSRWRRWTWLALAGAGIAMLANALAGATAAEVPGFSRQLAITWQPTSLGFVLRNGGLAVAIIAFLACRSLRRGLPRFVAPLAAVGRSSLTHYLAHVLLVYAPLRTWWPAEDWSVGVGVAAAGGYALFALVASPWWFRRARRGPLEWLLAKASGPAR